MDHDMITTCELGHQSSKAKQRACMICRGLSLCRGCGCMISELTTECPRTFVPAMHRDRIIRWEIDFYGGRWMLCRSPVVLAHNKTTDRYHPVIYRREFPTKDPVTQRRTGWLRYLSLGHHVEGFATAKEALAWVAACSTYAYTGIVLAWDGIDDPVDSGLFLCPDVPVNPDMPVHHHGPRTTD